MKTETANAEMRFWAPRLANGGARQIMESLDWGHQRMYLPLVAKWGLNLLRNDFIIEFGCGPCGLAPWFQRAAMRVGVEPLTIDFEMHGIDYPELGYDCMQAMAAQEYIDLFKSVPGQLHGNFNLAISCNVIDHDPDPQAVLDAIAQTAPVLFVCYDLRFKATELHPGITAGGLRLPPPWELKQQEEISMAAWPAMLQEVTARICQLWMRP